MTKVALLALLATAKIAAAPVYYKADILLTSAYRVLEWSRTPALFIHDEKHHEYRTPRVLAIPGKEHVLVDGNNGGDHDKTAAIVSIHSNSLHRLIRTLNLRHSLVIPRNPGASR